MSQVPERRPTFNRGELQNRAVKGALWTGLHTLVSLPLAFGVNILLARVLGVVGYGQLIYLTTIITIASVVAGMGVTTALIQFGAKAHAAGRVEQVQRYLSGAQGFRLLVTGPLVALAVVSFVRVETWILVVALVFGVGAPALLSSAQPALTIENRTDRGAQLTMLGNILVQTFVVTAVLTLGTPEAVWSARVVAAGLLLSLPLLSISKHYRTAVLRPRGPWTLPRKFWRFAVPTGAAAVLGALTSNRIEVVLLNWFADPVAMGVFALAFGLAGHLYAPAQALVGPLLPAVSGLAEIDRGALRRAFFRTSRVAGTVGGVLVGGALPALGLLVPVLYGQEFVEASDHVVVLGMAGAVMLIGSPHIAFLMARLGGRRLLWINTVALVVNIGLGLALIPLLGVWGATLAATAAMVARTAFATLGEAETLTVPVRELLRSLGGMLVGLATCSVVWLVVRDLPVEPIVLAAGAVVGGLLLYTLALRVIGVGLSPEDVKAIEAGLPPALRKPARLTLSLTAQHRGSEA